MATQSTRLPRGNRQTVIIGFDFGTHSTKVVIRERGGVGGRIAQFDEPSEGYPTFASPSVVRHVRGRLYFGTEALIDSDGQLFRSLKVSLLPSFLQLPGDYPSELDNRTLIAAYFAWAFQQLRRSLTEYSEANVLLNLAAPMSHIEDPALKRQYLQIIQAAWNVSFVDQPIPILQGISGAEVARIFAPLLAQSVVGPELRRFEVLPETIAPVVSLSLDPWMEPGMYMIIDTGAGTTEMSVFHAGDAGADQKVLCYRDETMLLGGNDLHLAERLEPDAKQVEINTIIRLLQQQYRRLWQLGYRLDVPNHRSRARWKELTLVLSGGGTKHELVADRLRGVNPMMPWPRDDTKLKVSRHVPGTLELAAEMDEDEASMFAVANGLAIERKNWPVVFQPDQIESLEPTEEVHDKPVAYWYLSE